MFASSFFFKKKLLWSFKIVGGEQRIIRDCGFIKETNFPNEDNCVRRSTSHVGITFCSCKDGDGCNNSNNHSNSFILICLPIVILLFKKFIIKI